MKKNITVHKLNERGEEVWRYSGEVLEWTPTRVTLAARFDRERIDVGGLILQRGDRFLETYYSDRWYNVFDVSDRLGRFKGWYCNVTRPARFEDGHVYAEDLALDLVVLPDGTSKVLDEEEYASRALSDDDRRQASQALESLQALVRERSGPFERLRQQSLDT